MTPEQLDTIFKAYDIRGTVPDQLDATIVRAIGTAFARFAAAPRVLIAHDMRESGPELAAAFSEGVRREGVDAVLLGLASTDMIYFAAGQARCAGRDAHRVAQPRGVQRHQALPLGRAAGRRRERPRRDQADDRSAAARRRHAARARRRVDGRPARRVRRPRALVHRCERAASDEGRGRHRERDGRPDRAPRCSTSCRSSSTCSSPSSTARSRTTPPTRSSPRTRPTCASASPSSAPTSAWRSTATRTACSSSTSRAAGCRARPPPRCSRWASSRSTLGRRSSTT